MSAARWAAHRAVKAMHMRACSPGSCGHSRPLPCRGCRLCFYHLFPTAFCTDWTELHLPFAGFPRTLTKLSVYCQPQTQGRETFSCFSNIYQSGIRSVKWKDLTCVLIYYKHTHRHTHLIPSTLLIRCHLFQYKYFVT